MFLNNEPCWGSFQVCIGHLHVLSICFFMIFFCVCVCVFEPVQIIYYVPLPFLQMVTFVVAIQSLSHVWFFMTPWTAARQASLSFTMSRSLLKLISIESVMPPNHLILCCLLLLLPCLSQLQGLFQWVGSLHQVDKGQELQLQHQSFQSISRVDFL